MSRPAPLLSYSDSWLRLTCSRSSQTLHTSGQAFAPTVPVAVMPYAATVLLALAFLLTFYFTT